jgi:nucleotide-binding universal stress UspA family protein
VFSRREPARRPSGRHGGSISLAAPHRWACVQFWKSGERRRMSDPGSVQLTLAGSRLDRLTRNGAARERSACCARRRRRPATISLADDLLDAGEPGPARQPVARCSTSQRSSSVEVRDVVRPGDIAAVVLDVAIEERARLIIVADSSRPDATARLLGGPWKHISHHAPCSVLIARRSCALRQPPVMPGSRLRARRPAAVRPRG